MTKKIVPFRVLTRRDFLQVLGATTAAAALTACGAPTAAPGSDTTTAPEQTTGDPQRGGALRVAFASPITQFDSALVTTREENHVCLAMYERLVTTDQQLTPQPGLAVAWESDDDLVTWTFTLREGVAFHHGTPFTAKDVVYTYERILDPDFGSPARALLSFIDRVEAVDDMTVRFHLSSPAVNLPIYLALPPATIAAHDQTAEQIATTPSGTGPFRFGEHRPGEQTILVRNEDYWDAPLPYLEELRFVSIAEVPTQLEALRSGTIDVIWQISSDVVSGLEQNDDLRVVEIPGGEHSLIAMTVADPPFDDVRVRQAFKHCVDRKAIVQGMLQGRGVVGNDQPIPPADNSWANVDPLAYDIERAKELLAEAGYPDGLEITLVTSEVRPGMVPLAVAFQEMAKPAGIMVTIEQLPAETYWSSGYLQTSLFTSDWPMQDSADIILGLGYLSDGVWNETGWKNADLDDLIAAARGEADPTQRQELQRQIQELISRDGGVIIPAFRPVISAMRAHVQGLQPLPNSFMYFNETWLTQEA